MTITIVPATLRHAEEIQLRPADQAEVLQAARRLGYENWRDVVAGSVKFSSCARAALEGDRVVALYGFSEPTAGICPWLLCSEEIRKYRKELVREWRKLRRWITGPGRPVFNFVPKGSPNIPFIKSLGFEVGDHRVPGFSEYHIFYLPHV